MFKTELNIFAEENSNTKRKYACWDASCAALWEIITSSDICNYLGFNDKDKLYCGFVSQNISVTGNLANYVYCYVYIDKYLII